MNIFLFILNGLFPKINFFLTFMIKNSNFLLFILILLFMDVSAQTLPSDLIWNDNETGYYEIKANNIDFTHLETVDQQLIISSSEIENIIEKLSIEEKIAM